MDNRKNFSPNGAKKAALLGLLAALAVAVSYLESLIPAYPGFPPGAKPGLSNIITMLSILIFSPGYAFAITLFKAVFAGVTRGLTAMLMSAAGGILSTCAACFLLRKCRKFGYTGIGMLCAVCHNTGQLAAACILTGSAATLTGYGPLLLIFALITGFITGTVLKAIVPHTGSIANLK